MFNFMVFIVFCVLVSILMPYTMPESNITGAALEAAMVMTTMFVLMANVADKE